MQPRHTLIDVVKGMLVAGMVLAHVAQLLVADPRPLEFFSDTANLISFPGYFFCFGFAAWLAYWRKDSMRWASILRTALKCYLAFVLSGLAFKIWVAHAPADAGLAGHVLLLRDIPGYSEFLLAFPLALLAGSLLPGLVRGATASRLNLALACLISLAATLLGKSAGRDPLLGLWIGGVEFAYFPVVPYAPLLLGGIYTARHGLPLGKKPMLMALAVTALCLYARRHGMTEQRFPPTALWIIRSFAGFYLFLGLAGVLHRSRWQRLSNYFSAVGRHVLLYLLCSNLLIFYLHHALGGRTLAVSNGVLVYFCIMAACALLHRGADSWLRRREMAALP